MEDKTPREILAEVTNIRIKEVEKLLCKTHNKHPKFVYFDEDKSVAMFEWCCSEFLAESISS